MGQLPELMMGISNYDLVSYCKADPENIDKL
jgi:hypothetical protein